MTVLTLSRSAAGSGIGRKLAELARLFGSIAAAQRAAADFERMNSRTDAALAARGLRRGDISRIVFERHFE